MALISFKQKVILAKIEAISGTDSVPAAATNGVLTMNMTIDLSGDKLERELDKAFLAANPYVIVGRMATIEFDFEPLGAVASGTPAPCAAIMRACAHAEVLVPVGPPKTATYNPISVASESCSIYFWMGAQQFKIIQCRGSLSFENEIKKFPKAHAKMVGQFALPTALALPSPTLTAWQDPPAIESTTWVVILNGVHVNATMFSLDSGVEVPMHEASELREPVLTDRKSNGKLKIYDPGVGVLDVWTLASSHTKVPLSSVVDGGANKKTSIVCPKIQISLPKFVEIEGIIGLEFDFNALTTSASGNDEYSVRFSDV